MTSAPHPILPQFSVGALHAPNTALSEVTWRHVALQRDGMLVTRDNAVCTHCQETTRTVPVPVPEVTKPPSDLPRSKKNNDMFPSTVLHISFEGDHAFPTRRQALQSAKCRATSTQVLDLQPNSLVQLGFFKAIRIE